MHVCGVDVVAHICGTYVSGWFMCVRVVHIYVISVNGTHMACVYK